MLHASDFKEFYDISAPLEVAPIYPGDRPFSQEWMARLNEGDSYNLSALALGSHAGTHLDFPSHLLKSGKSQDQYPLKRFILSAEVVCVSGDGPVLSGCLQGSKIDKGQALLFKTDNSQKRLMHQAAFSEDFVCLSLDVARLCVADGVSLVGIDYLSVDKYGDDSLPIHRTLLENDILILEGIDLSAAPSGVYTLICLPLSIKGAEASLVRAVLVR
ncbi:MAG: cyclase family protein [Methanothrix sp.]|nr:cyclase family protein [Methanothrix sp.]MDD4447602.1 cyclase family protein [Methanothrix sp.]